MFKTFLIIIILNLGLIFQGCAFSEYFGVSPKENTQGQESQDLDESVQRQIDVIGKENKNSDKVRYEMAIAKDLNKLLSIQISQLKEENQKISDETMYEMSSVKDQNKLLSEQIRTLKEENQKISDKNTVLVKKISDLNKKYMTITSETYNKPGSDSQKLIIKVLSGDGTLNSAKAMSQRLKELGYKIALIDSAPKSSFVRNTIYFASAYKTEAQRLGSLLVGKAILKPLSWHSRFNLIVVTGKNP